MRFAKKTSSQFSYLYQLAKTLGFLYLSTDEYMGKWYAVSGVNIVNGAEIQGKEKFETSVLITNEVEVLLNINTLKDLEIAEKTMKKQL